MTHFVRRLKQEIMKVLVFPNLDDEVLPFMDHISYSVWGTENNSPFTPNDNAKIGDTIVNPIPENQQTYNNESSDAR